MADVQYNSIDGLVSNTTSAVLKEMGIKNLDELIQLSQENLNLKFNMSTGKIYEEIFRLRYRPTGFISSLCLKRCSIEVLFLPSNIERILKSHSIENLKQLSIIPGISSSGLMSRTEKFWNEYIYDCLCKLGVNVNRAFVNSTVNPIDLGFYYLLLASVNQKYCYVGFKYDDHEKEELRSIGFENLLRFSRHELKEKGLKEEQIRKLAFMFIGNHINAHVCEEFNSIHPFVKDLTFNPVASAGIYISPNSRLLQFNHNWNCKNVQIDELCLSEKAVAFLRDKNVCNVFDLLRYFMVIMAEKDSPIMRTGHSLISIYNDIILDEILGLLKYNFKDSERVLFVYAGKLQSKNDDMNNYFQFMNEIENVFGK